MCIKIDTDLYGKITKYVKITNDLYGEISIYLCVKITNDLYVKIAKLYIYIIL